jgi:hypothetical protein
MARDGTENGEMEDVYLVRDLSRIGMFRNGGERLSPVVKCTGLAR